MHNWRLLLLAFLAVFHSTASFTERNLVDGRDQCSDYQPSRQFRETKLSYGTYRLGKSVSDERRLNHRSDIREDRRFEVRKDDSVLTRPSGDRKLVEYRLESDSKHSTPGFTYRFTRTEFRRLRDTEVKQRERVLSNSQSKATQRIAYSDSTRISRIKDSDIRQHDNENHRFANSRLYRAKRGIVRSNTDEQHNKISMDSRRVTQENRANSGELQRIRYIRETRNILQERDDVERTVSRNHNSERVARERADDRRHTITTQPELRRLNEHNKERRSLERRDSRISRQSMNERRTESRPELVLNRFHRSMPRSDSHFAVEMTEERRSSNNRSDSKLQRNNNRESRSFQRNERSILRERTNERREFSARSEPRLNTDIRNPSLERSDRQMGMREDNRRTQEARFESRLQLNADRQSPSLERSDSQTRMREDNRRSHVAPSESRLQLNADRRSPSLERSDRLKRMREDNRRTQGARFESRLQLKTNKRSSSLERSDRQTRMREDNRRTHDARSESRLQLNAERRSPPLERSDRQMRVQDTRRAHDGRSESRLHLNANRRSLSLERNDREMRLRVEDRRSSDTRSESRLQLNADRRSPRLERSDRQIRMGEDNLRTRDIRSESRLQLNADRRSPSLERSERQMRVHVDDRRSPDARSESRLQLNVDRRHLSLERSESQMLVRVDELRSNNARFESRQFDSNRVQSFLKRSDRRITGKVEERRSSLRSMAVERRDFKKESKADNSMRHIPDERQLLNSRREIVKRIVERQQQRNNPLGDRRLAARQELQQISADRYIRESADRSRNLDMRSIRLERSVTRREVRFDERQSRVSSGQARPSSEFRRLQSRNMEGIDARNRDNLVKELKERRSVNQHELRESRRDVRLTRSLDVARTKEIASLRVEYRITRNNMERENFRFRANTGFTRSRETAMQLLEETQVDDQNDTMSWQYIFYTLQGIYLCSVLMQILSQNGSEKKKSRALHWWYTSQSPLKVD